MTGSFVESLRKLIRDDMNTYCDQLANGIAKDFAEYRNLVGVIHGLALAEDHLVALAKKASDQDE